MRLGSDCDEAKAAEVLTEIEAEYKALRDRRAEQEASEAEQVEEAVQVVLARDIKPPVEARQEEKGDWVLVDDAIFDEDAGAMVLKLADGAEHSLMPTGEIEVRSPQAGEKEGDGGE
jgi:hypothetical protein